MAEAPDAADLRPLRRRRSALARLLSRPWRLPGAGTGLACRWRGSDGIIVKRSCTPACAAAAAPAFPTGIKWKTVPIPRRAQIHRLQCRRGRQRHVRRPDDHGRRSLRADRGHDDRRHRGRRDARAIVYIRSEYPHAVAAMRPPSTPRKAGLSRRAIVPGSAHAFDMEVRVGAGAYVCGEETSLLEQPGRPARHRPRQAAAAGA
jgi:hypothetical protein